MLSDGGSSLLPAHILKRKQRSIRHTRAVAAAEPPKDRRRRLPRLSRRRAQLAACVLGVCALFFLCLWQLPVEPGVQSRLPDSSSQLPATADGADVATAPAVNIAIASDEEAPFGLLGVVNSTLVHCATPAALRFHLIVPNARRAPLRSQLERLWPRLHVRTYSLDGGGVRAKIARHLRQSEREPLFASPFRYAVAYLPSLLPAVRRVLFLHTDVLLRADVAPLYASFELAGAPAAAVEDCATPLSALVDTASPALSSFSPSSCALDPAVPALARRSSPP